jgi:hypothetical protein
MYVLTIQSDDLDALEAALVRIWRIIEAAGLPSPTTRILHPAADDWRLVVSFRRKRERDRVRAELEAEAKPARYQMFSH